MNNQNFLSFQNLHTKRVIFCDSPKLISSAEVLDRHYSDHEFVSISFNLKPIKNGPMLLETRTLNQQKNLNNRTKTKKSNETQLIPDICDLETNRKVSDTDQIGSNSRFYSCSIVFFLFLKII